MKKGNMIVVGLAIAVTLLPITVWAEDWRETGCAGVVEAELEKLDIDALGAARVTYVVSSRGSVASEGYEELNGWVSFEKCKGNLTVQLSENCTVTMMYTSGQCRIPGVEHY
ncbi:hypothetical protein [Sneathiella sp. HT1-7]|jgi:hypothetical protein|uniref:hypothetical protein n=1 Tax=Sneathiella sp. HT1-7 TaxID=2887192 RepID=UPI001D1348AB|nr:hypothetical protein [Sneathiella sp. HT1-7]MCC3306575.1 hypothetical protein [Sneathiella sp. HT1-7]